MNWKIKAHVLAVLSRCPGGRHIYQTLQSCLRTDRASADEYVDRALEIVQMVQEGGRDPFRGVYLEIGTGWKPYLPFILSLVGAERVITLDVNPWLTAKSAAATFNSLADRLPVIADRLKVALAPLEERFRVALPHVARRADLLNALRVDYRYPADARRTGLADQSVDVVCSSNVLEHVPPEVLAAIHRESFRILRPGGLAVHRFNPQDHFCEADPSITAVNFLRYSERQWRWYGGTGLAYHNRLRCRHHQRLLEEAGLEVRSSRVRINQRALEQIRRGEIAIHPDFAGFTPEELAADYMWAVCARPAHQPSEPRPTGSGGPLPLGRGSDG